MQTAYMLVDTSNEKAVRPLHFYYCYLPRFSICFTRQWGRRPGGVKGPSHRGRWAGSANILHWGSFCRTVISTACVQGPSPLRQGKRALRSHSSTSRLGSYIGKCGLARNSVRTGLCSSWTGKLPFSDDLVESVNIFFFLEIVLEKSIFLLVFVFPAFSSVVIFIVNTFVCEWG